MSELILLTLPLGNSQDLSHRGLSVLQNEQHFFVEDTRSFAQFLKHWGISPDSKKIDSFHDHSDKQKLKKIMETLHHSNVVLCSEAGSPYISDPAYPVVVECNEKQIKVNSIPGPSSVITALELSGFPPIPFHFHGFLPRTAGEREKYLDRFKFVQGTHIFFEGLSRVSDTCDQLASLYPEHEICLVREMTKEFQSIYNFQGKTWNKMKEEIFWKGEFVGLVHIPESVAEISKGVEAILKEIDEEGMKPKLVAKLYAELTGKNVKDVYSQLSHK